MTLVLGGARSGKSTYAEQMIEATGAGLYLATAGAGDDEMRERIRLHRARRGPLWQTIEEPIDLAEALARETRPDRPILVDCLTLWLGNIMGADRDIEAAVASLASGLAQLSGCVVFVSNEVGLGIVPPTPLGRAFRDHAGRLNQKIAAVAQRVVFVAAGIPLTLKDIAP
ncbi:MAG: bifunctional adenosylcobinamide kinase/adenosylcobinamide-phosphate guanylyltransferase [Rhodospirillales bacterium]|nr:bifunctional adenosylcobinamide kinase/adenosylcobinamide-phosphate guanylyltransferase [Rhodospirillales bacterium]